MKTCTICKDPKPLSEFNKNKSRKDGYNSLCRVCSNKRSKRYYSENREHHKSETYKRRIQYRNEVQIFLREFLSKNPCADCGNTDIRVLEFDHLPKFKKQRNISSLYQSGVTITTIQLELKKCEVVCANCHRIRTVTRSKKNYRNASIV